MTAIKKIAITSALCLLTITPVHAGYRYNDNSNALFERLINQHQQIERGVERGKLTKKEERLLRQQQHRLLTKAARFRKDGTLSSKERAILHNMLDRNAKRIKKMKRNDYNDHVGYHIKDQPRHYQRHNRWW